MILLSAPLNGSNVVANMIAPINFKIRNNVCGAICYLTKQDVPSTSVNTSFINDKDNMLSITGNTCKYIYCGYSSGFINYSSNRNVNNIITSNNIYSGSTTISENTCSWIHIGVKNPTSYAYETPTLNVVNNKINA
jgi:hypothetical protein